MRALTVRDETSAFFAFAFAALTINLVMALLVLAIGTAQERLLRSMRSGTQTFKQLGGVILILVGAWLLALGIWVDAVPRILYASPFMPTL